MIITVELNDQQESAVQELLASGLYGATEKQVLFRLIDAGLIKEMKEGLIERPSPKILTKTQSSF